MKKFISVLMCAMMVLSMCTIVNATTDDLTVVAKVGTNEVTSVVIDEVVEFTVSVKNVANADSAYIELGFTEDFEMVEGSLKYMPEKLDMSFRLMVKNESNQYL